MPEVACSNQPNLFGYGLTRLPRCNVFSPPQSSTIGMDSGVAAAYPPRIRGSLAKVLRRAFRAGAKDSAKAVSDGITLSFIARRT
jgi:hypothetical protein